MPPASPPGGTGSANKDKALSRWGQGLAFADGTGYLQPLHWVPWSPSWKDAHWVSLQLPTLFWVQPTWISFRVQW